MSHQGMQVKIIMRNHCIPPRIAMIICLKEQKISNLGDDTEKWETPYITDGNVKCCSTVESSLAVFEKSNVITTRPHNPTLKYIHKNNKYKYLIEYLHKTVQNNTVPKN